MELFIHSQTSTVPLLKFVNNFISHVLMDVITYHVDIKVDPCQLKGSLAINSVMTSASALPDTQLDMCSSQFREL